MQGCQVLFLELNSPFGFLIHAIIVLVHAMESCLVLASSLSFSYRIGIHS